MNNNVRDAFAGKEIIDESSSQNDEMTSTVIDNKEKKKINLPSWFKWAVMVVVVAIGLIIGLNVDLFGSKEDKERKVQLASAVQKINLSDCAMASTNCEVVLNVADNPVKISWQAVDDDNWNFFIGEKMVASEIKLQSTAEVWQDVILFSNTDENIRTAQLSVYDINGNQVKDFTQLETVPGMVLGFTVIDNYLPGSQQTEEIYVVEDQTLYLSGSRMDDGPSVVWGDSAVNICGEALSATNLSLDTPVEVIYKTVYHGGGQFEEVIPVQIAHTISDYINFCP